MCTSVQKLSECRVLLCDSKEKNEGYGSVGIRLKALAENFFSAVDLTAMGIHSYFSEVNAVYAMLIVRGNRARVAFKGPKGWECYALYTPYTQSAIYLKRKAVNLGFCPKPHQDVPPKMKPESAANFVNSCPFLRVGDFVVSACWGKGIVSNVSGEGPTFSLLFWEDSVSYPFAAP